MSKVERGSITVSERKKCKIMWDFIQKKIKNMCDRTELLQEKADDLERVKRYAGAEQVNYSKGKGRGAYRTVDKAV